MTTGKLIKVCATGLIAWLFALVGGMTVAVVAEGLMHQRAIAGTVSGYEFRLIHWPSVAVTGTVVWGYCLIWQAVSVWLARRHTAPRSLAQASWGFPLLVAMTFQLVLAGMFVEFGLSPASVVVTNLLNIGPAFLGPVLLVWLVRFARIGPAADA